MKNRIRELEQLLARKDSEMAALLERNEKLSRQIVKLVRSHKGNEETRQSNEQDSKHLMEFVQKVSRKSDDESLYQTIIDHIRNEFSVDRTSILLKGSGSVGSIVSTYQSCGEGIREVPLPCFVGIENDDLFRIFLEETIKSKKICAVQWERQQEIHPGLWIHSVCARALEIPHAGTWILVLQWQEKNKMLSASQMELFEDLILYAAVMIEQTQLLEGIRELKDQKESIIESMPSAMIGLDFLANITSWNGQASRFFGYREQDVIGHNLVEILPNFSDLPEKIPNAIQGEQNLLVLDIRKQKTPAGKVIHLQPHLFNMLNSNRGEFVLRIDDMTKQVDLQNQLFHAQKMEIVGTLAGGLSHDFNNILSGIVGTTSLIRKRWTALGGVQSVDWEDLGVIENCSQNAVDLVNRLLALSKKSDLQKRPVNLVRTLKNVYKLCLGSFDQRISIHLNVPNEESWILGDENQLENAVLNLCINSRDAMPEGGDLHLSLERFISDREFNGKHHLNEETCFYRIEVKDTGEGIASEVKRQIFDAFFTTKKDRGTGLGLTIVESAVDTHGGILELESKETIGTTFKLNFPCVDDIDWNLEQPILIPQKKMALLVDDDQIIRKVGERLLNELNFDVISVNDGTEAIRRISSEPCDFVVLDVDMPGLNGIDTFRILRQVNPEIPVLFCTGRRGEYPIEESLTQPNCMVLEKPYNFDQLELALMELLPEEFFGLP